MVLLQILHDRARRPDQAEEGRAYARHHAQKGQSTECSGDFVVPQQSGECHGEQHRKQSELQQTHRASHCRQGHRRPFEVRVTQTLRSGDLPDHGDHCPDAGHKLHGNP